MKECSHYCANYGQEVARIVHVVAVGVNMHKVENVRNCMKINVATAEAVAVRVNMNVHMVRDGRGLIKF